MENIETAELKWELFEAYFDLFLKTKKAKYRIRALELAIQLGE